MGTSSRSKRPEPIGSILAKLLDESHWGKQIKELEALVRWPQIVGPQISRQTQPESFKDGVLMVRVQNSVWLSHLRFLTAELREKLNRAIPSSPIKEILFRLGSVDPPAAAGSPKKTPLAER